jgi:RNA polymerase sigma-32 factor
LRAKIDRTGVRNLSDSDRIVIADQLNVTLNDVKTMERRLSGGDSSLSAGIGEDGESSAQDFLADKRPNPEDYVIGKRDSAARSRWLHEALQELSPRERFIISKRRLQEDGETLEALGKEMGVSKERVRQLETRAMKKLYLQLKDRVPNRGDFFNEDAGQ